MNKPFEMEELKNRLKAEGLPMAEDAIQKAAKVLFGWAGDSCAMKGGLYAVAVPIMPIIADQVDKLADKIDGVEGK